MGRKEVRKEPNCFPSSHLCAPERGFRPRTLVAATKLCPFKGTVDSRRGGGKDASSRLLVRWRRGNRLKAAVTCGCGGRSLPLPQRPQPAPAYQGDV